jgi:peptidoglycan/xylan/chitin deacetylase (PgdA/CDA1 family)
VQRIALTFDDGPSAWTEAVLDTLVVHGARATFFVIGSLAADRAHVLQRMIVDGHEVGNHTWSHPRLAQDCDDQRVHAELEQTNDVLAEIIGRVPHRFRAPQYNVDGRVEAIASRLGLSHTRGDVRPPDWDPRCTAAFIATFVLQQARSGVVVGLHDGVPPKKVGSAATRGPTVEAVATMLPRLVERGFECVTASMLLDESTADYANHAE